MPLFIVATPIGNSKDITLRALETLEKVDLILSEDTRRTKNLLSIHNISTPLESFHEHNEELKLGVVISRLKNDEKIALVSDAGTPLLSDPGFKLVRECIQQNLRAESIPGPSAILTALTASGLPTDQFLFIGYLPKKVSKRRDILDFCKLVLESRPTTIIFFESPYRLQRTLQDLASKFPERQVVVARELTKLHEEFIRSTAKEIQSKKINPKGEITILLR